MKYNNMGFTLIELLVVVLIIGILAAVALPQYQKAIIKSRVSTILPILQSLGNAEEIYYLTNGQYTTNANLLDISMPAECTEIDSTTNTMHWSCGNNFIVSLASGDWQVGAQYCPSHTNSFDNCQTVRDFSIYFDLTHQEEEENMGAISGGKRCFARTQAGVSVCKNLPNYTYAGLGAS